MGYEGANILHGGNGNDTLHGDISSGLQGTSEPGETDTLLGGDGDDVLYASNSSGGVLHGGNGNDTLSGGWAGTSTLNGGAGADVLHRGMVTTFVFNSASDADGDEIPLFGYKDKHDKIDVSGIDANLLLPGNQAFTWIGSGAFTGPGQLRYSDTKLEGNTDSDPMSDFTIRMTAYFYTEISRDLIL